MSVNERFFEGEKWKIFEEIAAKIMFLRNSLGKLPAF